ncbi:alpha/beta hydrolase [uncultured Aquimarina sp.]|uniref:alpha/beta hydrolase fold domain-containing protein n=1 Tax=uncultured Aquimarina sp. TaxID=575652 RepID=UPI002639510B|nr:alpha/beta hydrolase [uncultured Aquimarina sp.]
MSFGYSIVKLVLKLKGVKKSWSEDPIDYVKKRRENVSHPSNKLLLGNSFVTKTILDTKVTEITPVKPANDYLLFYCHGGAFVYGPTENNWESLARIVKYTNTRAWMIDYPKAPENNIEKIAQNICEAYYKALEKFKPSKIIFIGDSVGGNLLTSLTQGLIRDNKQLPNRLVLVTPMMDASLTNHRIHEIDSIDPILSYKGVHSAKKMCAGNFSLKDPIISPLYGSFKDFPPIHIFVATNDILMPDQEVFIEKVKEEGGSIEVVVGEGMPHIWPLLPFFKEAKMAMEKIISIINDAVLNDK